uniref:Cyclin C n=1 Tax=Crocodylus porosus TaxID=8502 RepID=A0A7M4FP33_CROPO
MAGNFWQSSHYLQWILDKQDLLKERQKDLKFLAEEEYWKLQIFFTNVIQALGEHLKLRQQVIATATVYFKRFYARYSLKSIDPVLMAPTCVFLASKVEFSFLEHYKKSIRGKQGKSDRLTDAIHHLLVFCLTCWPIFSTLKDLEDFDNV